MQVTVQRISSVVMELEVAVPADTVKAELEKAYTDLAKKAQIKGFRQGKAPRNILQKMFAPQVQRDVVNQLVNDTLPKALEEKSVTPINQPQVEPLKFEANSDFQYKARFEVQPEVEKVDFEGFALSRSTKVADEKSVEEQLAGLQQRLIELKSPEPMRAAKTDDVLTIDFTVEVEGKVRKDAEGKSVQVELGSAQLLSEVDSALVGKSVGENVSVDVTFPEQHPQSEIRGKKGKLHVTLVEVKEKMLPVLDDAFAKKVANFETLVELRADIHTKLEKAIKEQCEIALAEQIVSCLNDKNPIEVPQSLVVQQANMMLQEIGQQATRSRAQFTEEQVKNIQENVLKDAERKVRAGLLMAAIAKLNGFKVTEEDIEKGLVELAEETGKNVAKLKVEYRDPNRRNILIGMILEDKILDFIESKSIITDAPAEEAVAAEASESPKPAKAGEKSASKKTEDET